jgi:hypothetical protein
MISTFITVKGVLVDVTYRMEGRYYPATREEPAEYPTPEIISWYAYAEDVEDTSYILSEQFKEDIYEAILEEETQNRFA